MFPATPRSTVGCTHPSYQLSLSLEEGVSDIVLDTTGLKVYGSGQWRAYRYGDKAKWKKLHLAIDLRSQKLTLAEVSGEYTHDTHYLKQALATANQGPGLVLIDGIADSQRCYELAGHYHKWLLTPPRKGAGLVDRPSCQARNDAIKTILDLGADSLARSIWAKLTGYSKRVIIESLIARWKRLFGTRLASYNPVNIAKEVRLKVMMINEMIDRQRGIIRLA